MRNIFLFLIFFFSDTHQLSCLYKCQMININFPTSCRDLPDLTKCITAAHATRCHGRIMIYFVDKYTKTITYSFGSTGHITEKEIEKLAIKNRFKSVVYFSFSVESFDTSEVMVSVHIVCQTGDNCALKYLTDLFKLYCKQNNPVEQLAGLFQNDLSSLPLTCYDYETKHSEECSINHPTCIFNKNDIIEQSCSSESNTRIEYAFMITSAAKNRIEKELELFICDKNDCNEESILKQIEFIVYNYTFGMNIPIDNSNKLKFYLVYFVYLFIFTIVFKD